MTPSFSSSELRELVINYSRDNGEYVCAGSKWVDKAKALLEREGGAGSGPIESVIEEHYK